MARARWRKSLARYTPSTASGHSGKVSSVTQADKLDSILRTASLCAGHSTATWFAFGKRALPPIISFVVQRVAIRPLVNLLPPRVSRRLLNHPITHLIFLFDATAFASLLLVPLSRRLTHEIVAIGRKARPYAADPLAVAAEDTTPPSLLAGVKSYAQKVHRMWQDPLLSLPVVAEVSLPLLVDAFAGWFLWRSFRVTGGAPRQLGLLAFRLASLAVLTPITVLRKRLALRPLVDPNALETVDVTAADVEVQPVKQDVKAELVAVLDEVLGPAPLELSWARLKPLYAGVEIDALRVVGGALGGFVGWRLAEQKRAKGRRWEWREWRGAWRR